MIGGFWRTPRALGPLLTTRALSPTEFTLLVFVGISGADRPGGFATTNEFLAASIGVSDKTLRRSLRALRAHGLVTYDDHPRVAGFTIRTAVTLEEVLGSFQTPYVTADASDTSASEVSRKPASVNDSAAVTSAVASRARAETETETETKAPPGVALARTTTTGAVAGRADVQALVAHFIDYAHELGAELVARSEIGHVASQLKRLSHEGADEETLRAAVRLMVDKNLPASMLPSLLREAQIGPRRPARPEHPSEAALRRAGIDSRRLLEGGGS